MAKPGLKSYLAYLKSVIYTSNQKTEMIILEILF